MTNRTQSVVRSAWARYPQAICAFFGALVIGILAHGMGLFNKYSWHDDIFALFQTGATVTSGRWMLHVLTQAEILLFGDLHASLPLFNGLCSILCIGISAGLMVSLLRIRSESLSVLLGGIMAAFPVVTALFGFMFTVHYYMAGFLMMTAGTVLILRGNIWWKKAYI